MATERAVRGREEVSLPDTLYCSNCKAQRAWRLEVIGLCYFNPQDEEADTSFDATDMREFLCARCLSSLLVGEQMTQEQVVWVYKQAQLL